MPRKTQKRFARSVQPAVTWQNWNTTAEMSAVPTIFYPGLKRLQTNEGVRSKTATQRDRSLTENRCRLGGANLPGRFSDRLSASQSHREFPMVRST
jgi:hypothetical protein